MYANAYLYGDVHAPTTIVAKTNNFLDFDPLEVSRQLTLIEHALFRKIKPQEW